MPATYAERLESVQAAIAAIEGGAEDYTIGNRRVKRADLETLYKQEKYLLGMVERDETSGGKARVRRIIPGMN